MRIRRVYAVVVDIVVTITGSIYFMLISDSFYGPFISFISVLAVPITAWIGCFLVDMADAAASDAHGLPDLRPGARYWYWHGISLAGTGSWLIGLVVGLLFMSAKISDTEVWFAGPLSHTRIGTNGLAWLVSLAVAAGLYALFGMRRKDDAAAAPCRRSRCVSEPVDCSRGRFLHLGQMIVDLTVYVDRIPERGVTCSPTRRR